MKVHTNTRREFLQTTLAAGAAAGLAGRALGDDTGQNGLATRPLGKTGVRVSMLCLGGWHIGAVKDEQEAIRIMHTAIDEGMTFFDNAWDYHDGGSEEVTVSGLIDANNDAVRGFRSSPSGSTSVT